MTIFILSLLGLTSGMLFLSIKKNMEYSEKLEDVLSQVEESLDILDEYYRRIDQKSRIHVQFDDPIVKDIIKDISESKQAILLVANKIYEPFSSDEDEELMKNENRKINQ